MTARESQSKRTSVRVPQFVPVRPFMSHGPDVFFRSSADSLQPCLVSQACHGRKLNLKLEAIFSKRTVNERLSMGCAGRVSIA